MECINAWEFWGCDHWPTPRYIAGGQLKDLYEQVYSQLKWNNNVDPKSVQMNISKRSWPVEYGKNAVASLKPMVASWEHVCKLN